MSTLDVQEQSVHIGDALCSAIRGATNGFGDSAKPLRWLHAGFYARWFAAFCEELGRFFSAMRQLYLEEPHNKPGGFWQRLPELTRPALFVWAERDRLVPAKFAGHVERALPNAQSVILQDCGHVPHYEQPRQTSALVRGFLADAG